MPPSSEGDENNLTMDVKNTGTVNKDTEMFPYDPPPPTPPPFIGEYFKDK